VDQRLRKIDYDDVTTNVLSDLSHTGSYIVLEAKYVVNGVDGVISGCGNHCQGG
jgi:hypothetical protein